MIKIRTFTFRALILIIILAVIYLGLDSMRIGSIIDSYEGVPVHYNGILAYRSFGKSYSPDSAQYYFGQKWQCVEFVKRYYYEARQHSMPDTMGHAKDFFDANIGQGQLNSKRGLIQFRNGESVPPKAGDSYLSLKTPFTAMWLLSLVLIRFPSKSFSKIFGIKRAKCFQ